MKLFFFMPKRPLRLGRNIIVKAGFIVKRNSNNFQFITPQYRYLDYFQKCHSCGSRNP